MLKKHHKHHRLLLLALCLTGGLGGPGVHSISADEIPVQNEAKAITHDEALRIMIEELGSKYPTADIAEKLVATLSNFRAAKNPNNMDQDAFIEAVNALLWDVAQDRHLKIYSAEALAKRYKKAGMKRMPRVREVRRVRSDQQGGYQPLGTTHITSEMLPDDIGLLKIHSAIYRNPVIFEQALQKVQDAKTIILDLTSVPGGSFPGVAHLVSYFFAEPTHLYSSYSRRFSEPMEMRTSELALSEVFAKKDLYVLIGQKSASGAEAVAFSLKIKDRATLVGNTTAGAGNGGATMQLGSNLSFFLPLSQSRDPETGQGWEGVGVTPHIKAEKGAELDTALEHIRTS